MLKHPIVDCRRLITPLSIKSLIATRQHNNHIGTFDWKATYIYYVHCNTSWHRGKESTGKASHKTSNTWKGKPVGKKIYSDQRHLQSIFLPDVSSVWEYTSCGINDAILAIYLQSNHSVYKCWSLVYTGSCRQQNTFTEFWYRCEFIVH